jgi:hypothetical protein
MVLKKKLKETIPIEAHSSQNALEKNPIST